MAIKNIDKLIKKFDDIEKIDLTQTIGRAAIIVQKKAKALCPVAEYMGGTLKGSIFIDAQKKGKTYIGRIYTNMEYAPYVEFGTGKTGDGTYPYDIDKTLVYKQDKWLVNIPNVGVRYTAGQVAQPFMYPAIIQSKEQVFKFVNDDVNRLLLNIAKGG